MNRKLIQELLFVVIMILFGVLTRTVWHIGPNIEFVTVLTLLGGLLIQTNWLRFLIPVIIMISSDLIIGNSNIIFFTWSAFLIVPIIGSAIKNSKINKLIGMEIGGIVGTLFFFLWTNFGVVVVSDMYPNSIGGLLESYYNGLPFLVNQLVGNLVIVPIVFVIGSKLFEVIDNLLKQYSQIESLNKSV